METKTKSKALEKFTEVTATLVNPDIRQWKKKGGKVVGYFCSHGPKEIIAASGMLPIRMRATGSKGTEQADAYLDSINCSFCRHCFNLGLIGEYDFIDGAVLHNTCDHARRIYDNWKRYVKTPFVEVMSLPKKTGQLQVDRYRGELVLFKEKLEKKFGVEISERRLWEEIKISNETRRLQRSLYDLRKTKNPPITGAETLAVIVASTAMPAAHYNELLNELLREISGKEGKGGYKARLMVVGSVLDNPSFIQLIEDQGGLVVSDLLCFGTKLMWYDIDESIKDPLTALADYYVTKRPSCPHMFGRLDQSVELIKNMVRDFKVDGIVGELMLFCDNWTIEHYMLSKKLKAQGIPYITLDREYTMGNVGQLRTRIQAFVETLGG